MAIYELDGISPELGDGAWVADSAEVIGRVHLGKNANVWPQVVIRGDNEPIRIGAGTNIQDAAVLHSDNGAKIGKNCLVGAGALVTEGKEFPDGSLIIGSPAKAVKNLNPEQIAEISRISTHYVDNAIRYRNGLKKIT